MDVERERGSARMDTSKLTEARSKQKAAEEFPDLDEGARRSGGKAKGALGCTGCHSGALT